MEDDEGWSGGDPMTSVTNAAQGYFSVVRWLDDPGRGEAKNLAILLFDPEGTWSKVRVAPLKRVLPRLTNTLVEEYLGYLEGRAQTGHGFTLGELRKLCESHVHSLQFTEPKPVAIPAGEDGPERAVEALYRAFVAPARPGGARKRLWT
jgi:hypothetical protein